MSKLTRIFSREPEPSNGTSNGQYTPPVPSPATIGESLREIEQSLDKAQTTANTLVDDLALIRAKARIMRRRHPDA